MGGVDVHPPPPRSTLACAPTFRPRRFRKRRTAVAAVAVVTIATIATMVTAVAGVAAAHRAQQQIHDLDMALAGRRTKGRAAVKVALVEVQRYRCLMCREEPYAFDVALPRGGLQCRREREKR